MGQRGEKEMGVSITIGLGGVSMDAPAPQRRGKGKSLIAFPADYCILDLETTGLSPQWDEIIEIGAIKYAGGAEVDRYQTLVRPEPDEDGRYIDAFIESLTDITNEMLAEAPELPEVLPEFAGWLGDLPIIGYNVNFDVNFLYDSCLRVLGEPLKNDYIDVLRMARRLYPDLPHHGLADMVAHFGLDEAGAHRAERDCEVTAECLARCRDEAVARYGSEDAFADTFKRPGGGGGVKAAEIQGGEDADPDGPLYGRYCVITGKLDRYSRREAMQAIADRGGINEDRVTKKTNYLILGDNAYEAAVKGEKTGKHKQAEKYRLAGQDIAVIPEAVFYDLLI